MGRRTWEGIPSGSGARRRVNIVLTSDEAYALPAGVLSATSLDEGLALAEDAGVETAVIIGGALFEETVRAFVRARGGEKLLAAFEAATTFARRTRLWRALLLYEEGGLYASMDARLDAPATLWLLVVTRQNDAAILGCARSGRPWRGLSRCRFDDGVLAFAPGHPIRALPRRRRCGLRRRRLERASSRAPSAAAARAAAPADNGDDGGAPPRRFPPISPANRS
ncbi:dihydrofolate reductase [Aureococcus anophagefferens]|nr:dihydrofolate reductase [Aureococcus anophagefferens]